jgi:hypothetical protein
MVHAISEKSIGGSLSKPVTLYADYFFYASLPEWMIRTHPAPLALTEYNIKINKAD